MAATATNRTQFQSDEAPTSLLSATTLLGPATVFVAAGLLVPLAILFRYSFNTFEPRRMMVETFALDNYVKFFSDPYYTGVLWTTLRVAALCTVICLAMKVSPSGRSMMGSDVSQKSGNAMPCPSRPAKFPTSNWDACILAAADDRIGRFGSNAREQGKSVLTRNV